MLSKYRGYATCPECKGQRLRAEARAVRMNGKNICEIAAITIRDANQFFSELKLTPAQHEIAGGILAEIRQRLHFLDAVGLDYLTLDRLAVDALRRRIAAYPARHFAGLAPGRCALRSGRAVDRPASARYRQAHSHPRRVARPGQHDPGGRARPGRDSRGRLACSTSVPAQASSAAAFWPRARSQKWRETPTPSPAAT